MKIGLGTVLSKPRYIDREDLQASLFPTFLTVAIN
jgi:hypothetical protein